MKKSKIITLYIFIILFVLIYYIDNGYSAQTARQPMQTQIQIEKKKFFITPFTSIQEIEDYASYKTILPRSIRASIRKTHLAEFDESIKKRSELLNKGYDFLIEGNYSIRQNEILIEFNVIYLKTNSFLIFADITGFNDRRIFDMIDRITLEINKTVSGNLEEIIKKPVIISVDKAGNISLKNLRGANLSRRNLSGISLPNIDMSGVNLSHSQLEGANFSGSNLSNAISDFANLRDANLSGANLSNARFRGANMRGVSFEGVNISDTDFRGAILDNPGDVNLGLSAGSGAFVWFLVEGRIYKTFFLGMRAGFTTLKDETLNFRKYNMPLLLYIKLYVLDKTTFYNPLIRPYISFEMGYSISLTKESEKGIIGLGLAGIDFNITKMFTLFVETGISYCRKEILYTVGAGMRFYLPPVFAGRSYEETSASSTPDAAVEEERQLQAERVLAEELAKKRYHFVGIKIGVGISSFIETPAELIGDDNKAKPRFSFNGGFRYMLYPISWYGFMVDLGFNRSGAMRISDNFTSRIDLDYIELTAYFSIKFAAFYAGLGVYGGAPINQKIVVTKPDESVSDAADLFGRWDFGGAFTLGYLFYFKHFKFFAGIDFKISFLNIVKAEHNIMQIPEDYKAYNWTLLFTIGFGI